MGLGEDEGGRATVALVAEMVRGLRALTESEFKGVQRQLDALSGLPSEVGKLRGDYDTLKERVKTLEGERDRDENRGYEWRRINRPAVATATCIVILNIGVLISQVIR